MTTNLLILLVLILLSGFFSAAEVAFVSLSNAKVSAMVKRKLPRSRLIKKLKKNPRRLLVTILIGNNVVNIASASLATLVAGEFFDSAVLGITTGVMTLVVLVFGEILPKSYATNHPKKVAIFAVPYLQLMEWVGYPIIVIFEWLTNLFTGKQTADKVSEEELRALAVAGAKQGSIQEEEGQMIQRLFQFNDITAEDVMTPRVDIVYVEDTESIKVAAEMIRKHPFTRYPVIHETPDEILGFVHSRDVLTSLVDKKYNTKLTKIMHPIMQVPKQMRIDELLKEFQKKQTHMAVVMDEYGGTEGIATLEDVLEELVGEIADEHDIEEDLIKRIDKQTILVSGDTELRDINAFLNISIPGDPLDVIAEILLDHFKKSPRKGMEVSFDDIVCRIEEVKKKVIQLVRISKPK